MHWHVALVMGAPPIDSSSKSYLCRGQNSPTICWSKIFNIAIYLNWPSTVFLCKMGAVVVNVLRVIGAGGAIETIAHRGSAQPLMVCTHQVGTAEKTGVHLTVRVRSSQGMTGSYQG